MATCGSLLVAAAARMALAIGCSLSASTAAASVITSWRFHPSAAAWSTTAWFPFVNVPVLSNRTASMVRILSSASRFFTRIPARADVAVEMEITSGIASPSACGQAITSTVTVRMTPSELLPASDHAIAVMAAAPVAR